MKIPADFPGQAELAEVGITSFSELDHLTDEQITSVPGIGPKTLEKIRASRERVPSAEEPTPVEVVREQGWWWRQTHRRLGSTLTVPRRVAEGAAAARPPFVRILDG